MELVDELIDFGLTRQEATIYITLNTEGELTGYEVAKLTGISRSGTYTALAGLVEKGAAYVEESNVTKYTPVKFEEFSRCVFRELTEKQQKIVREMPIRKEETEGYITIRGRKNILNKLRNMLEEAQQRVYTSVPGEILSLVEEDFKRLVAEKKKVVILTNCEYSLGGATVYYKPDQDNQIRLIIDSFNVLTGRLDDSENSTCLYSRNQNLVDVFKEMLKNEIILINMKNEE